MIFDQRYMTGLAVHRSVEEVAAAWERVAEEKGFRQRVRGEIHHELLRSKRKLEAYVSDSRWVADCPECGGGIACWVENPEGCCLDCGRVYKVAFPKDWREIERVLLPRPPENRHFLPGETLEDLKLENITRGVPLETPTVEG